MTEESLDPSDLLPVLRGLLPDTMRDLKASSAGPSTPAGPGVELLGRGNSVDPPTQEELFDLVEGRLSATEREDLLERIAASPEAQEALADILTGIELSEPTPTDPRVQLLGELGREGELSGETWLVRIRSWLSPSVLVPALSLCLLLLVALPMLQGPQVGPGSESGLRDVGEGIFGDEPTPTPTAVAGEVLPATDEVTAPTR